jgi:hypothetical protein
MELNEIISWVLLGGLKFLAGAGALLIAFRIGTSAIRDLVPQLMRAQAESLPSGTSSDGEIDKRIATIQDLLTKLLRVAALALLVALVLAILDLWSILTAIQAADRREPVRGDLRARVARLQLPLDGARDPPRPGGGHPGAAASHGR